MTIHRSKGLEWDVVIVPGLEKTRPPDRGRLLAWDEIDSGDDAAARVVLAPIKSKGKDSEALNAWLNGIRSAREDCGAEATLLCGIDASARRTALVCDC